MPISKDNPGIDIGKIVNELRFPAAKIRLSSSELKQLESGVRRAFADLTRDPGTRGVVLTSHFVKEKLGSQLDPIFEELPLAVTLPKLSADQVDELKYSLRDAIFSGAMISMPGGITVKSFVYCSLAYNREKVQVSDSVSCDNGHHFCKKHQLLNCPHDGLQLH